MAHKFAFELTDAGAPNQYAIRLVDRKQIAALALAEGFAKPIPLSRSSFCSTKAAANSCRSTASTTPRRAGGSP